MKHLKSAFIATVLCLCISQVSYSQEWRTSYPGNMYLYPSSAYLSIGNGSLYPEKLTINESGTINPFGIRVNNNIKFIVKNDGKVGIGTSSPSAFLHISGGGNIILERPDFTNFKASMAISLNDGPIGLRCCVYPDGNLNNYTEILFLASNGNVGIGNTNPTSKLTVNGEIKCEKVRVVSDVPSADYVFSSDYNLLSIKDVENFINENKHLPDVPSADEFIEKGYDVGNMDEILLKKIEEQTLYIIELNKRLELLEETVRISNQ